MIYLIPSTLDSSLYKVGMLDAPGNGSKTSMYHNIIECSSTLNPFENVYEQILPRFKAFGYAIFDYADFEEKVKPLYQLLRHGLAFDWILNYVIIKIHRVFPFCYFKEFKGTEKFIYNQSDAIFESEIQLIDEYFSKLLTSLFLGLDSTVFTRLSTDANSDDFLKCVVWARENDKIDDYYITEDVIYNMNYLVALGLMIEHCVGYVKRAAWHNLYEKIQNSELEGLIVSGGKFRAFAYGRLKNEDKPTWHRFDLGIQYFYESSRSQREDILRVFPDEMTFFRFTQNSILIDESYFPLVSFNGGETWLNTNTFKTVSLEMDIPHKMKIRYKFPLKEGEERIIKIKGKNNCVVKDNQLVLNSNGEAETQILFRGENIGFKISESKKEYPFAVFTSSKLTIKNFEWLSDE